MQKSLVFVALVAVVALAACEKKTTFVNPPVYNTPSSTVVVPVPVPGPSNTVVMPPVPADPASAPAK